MLRCQAMHSSVDDYFQISNQNDQIKVGNTSFLHFLNSVQIINERVKSARSTSARYFILIFDSLISFTLFVYFFTAFLNFSEKNSINENERKLQ